MATYYLDKTGLTYFWGKIKTAISGKQDALTAGTGISINNNTISASGFTKIITVSSLPTTGIDDNAIYVVVPNGYL